MGSPLLAISADSVIQNLPGFTLDCTSWGVECIGGVTIECGQVDVSSKISFLLPPLIVELS